MIGRLQRHVTRCFVFCLVVGLLDIVDARAEADVQVEVSPQSATIDDTFVVTVRVVSRESESLEAPTFEKSGEFVVGNTSRSTQLLMVNGVTSSVQTFDIEFKPSADLRPGAYSLPRGYWEVNGERVYLKTLKVHIVPPRPEEKLAAFAQVVDNIAPYVGQQVIYRAEAATKHELVETVLDEIPFSGFLRQSFGRHRELIRRIGYGSTTVYTVREALFPTRSGKIVIDSRGAVLRFQLPVRGSSRSQWGSFPQLFPDFLDRVIEKRQRMSSLPIELNVQPLPPTEIPWKGAVPVGNVSLGFSLSKNSVTLGDSIELRIELRGDADLRSVAIPLRESIDPRQFKIYENEPSLGTKIEDERVQFTKDFNYALLPLKAGSVRIPPIHVLTFDPSIKDYRVLELPEQQIEVRPSSDGKVELSSEDRSREHSEVSNPEQEAPAEAALDVSPYAPLRPLSRHHLPPLNVSVILTVLVGVPITMVVAGFARRFLLPEKRRVRRLRRAIKRFRKKSRVVSVPRSAVHSLREFVESWFGGEVRSWTDRELEERLLQDGFRSSTVERLRAFHVSVAPVLYGAENRDTDMGTVFAEVAEALLSDAELLLRRDRSTPAGIALASTVCVLLLTGCNPAEAPISSRNHGEALVQLERRLPEDPTNVSLFNNVGILQALSGAEQEAYLAFYYALQLSPTDTELRSNFDLFMRTAQFEIVDSIARAPLKLQQIRELFTLRGLEYLVVVSWMGAAAIFLLLASIQSRIVGTFLVAFALVAAIARYGVFVCPDGSAGYSAPWSRPYYAFVRVPNTIVYSEPTKAKGQRIAVFSGREIFQVVGEREGWLKIRYGSSRVGWIQAEHFRYLPRVL